MLRKIFEVRGCELYFVKGTAAKAFSDIKAMNEIQQEKVFGIIRMLKKAWIEDDRDSEMEEDEDE